jgi:anti-sigma factor RsiW
VSADKIDFKMLNAYVDGELDLPQQAEVADAIAREPSLGRQVATLTRLKSEAAESIETLDRRSCWMDDHRGDKPRKLQGVSGQGEVNASNFAPRVTLS